MGVPWRLVWNVCVLFGFRNYFVCVYVCGTACMPVPVEGRDRVRSSVCLSSCRCPRRQEVLDFRGAGVAGGYEAFDWSAGNPTQVFCASTMLS